MFYVNTFVRILLCSTVIFYTFYLVCAGRVIFYEVPFYVLVYIIRLLAYALANGKITNVDFKGLWK